MEGVIDLTAGSPDVVNNQQVYSNLGLPLNKIPLNTSPLTTAQVLKVQYMKGFLCKTSEKQELIQPQQTEHNVCTFYLCLVNNLTALQNTKLHSHTIRLKYYRMLEQWHVSPTFVFFLRNSKSVLYKRLKQHYKILTNLKAAFVEKKICFCV